MHRQRYCCFNRYRGLHPARVCVHVNGSKRNQAAGLVGQCLYLCVSWYPAACRSCCSLFRAPSAPVIGEYLVLDRFVAASLAFVLNYAAYFAEIFRGGLLAIDKGQYEASKVLGLNRWQTTTRVILPQMFRVALPAVSNESITLVKDTASLYAVAVPELLHFAYTAVNRDVTIMPFFIAGVIYLLMTLVLTMLFKFLERRFKYE